MCWKSEEERQNINTPISADSQSVKLNARVAHTVPEKLRASDVSVLFKDVQGVIQGYQKDEDKAFEVTMYSTPVDHSCSLCLSGDCGHQVRSYEKTDSISR